MTYHDHIMTKDVLHGNDNITIEYKIVKKFCRHVLPIFFMYHWEITFTIFNGCVHRHIRSKTLFYS